MRHQILTGLGGAMALALAFLGNGCSKNPFSSGEAKTTNTVEMAVPVEVAPVQRGAIEAIIRTSTHLEAESEVKVFARTANRVTSLLVEEGSLVAPGDILLRMEDDTQKTQFEKARNNLDKARREFERSRALHEQKLISEQAFSDVQFELRQRELALEDAARELEYTVVKAPIGGTVTRRLVKAGDLVGLNQHLFDLIDFKSIVARVYVPERGLSQLAPGKTVRVTSTALPGQTFAGHIERIAPVVESKTGTVKVTVAFADPGPLRPGMYVTTDIVTATRTDALLISKRALVLDNDQTFAFRIGPDRRAERLLVVPRVADGLNVEPTQGFAEGDSIVVAGQTGLKDGARVRLPGDPDPEDKDKEGKPATAGSASTASKGKG